MNWKDKALIGLTAFVLIAGAIAGYFYMAQRADIAVAAERDKAAKQQIADLNKQQADRDALYQKRMDSLESEIRAIRTAPQATRTIEKYIPQVVGQAAEVKREELPAAVQAKLPDSPGYVIRTDAAEIAVAKEQVKCAQDRESLGKCSGDLKDETAKAAIEKKRADDWEKTAKGGSWIKRAATTALKIGIGFGVGYLAGRAHK